MESHFEPILNTKHLIVFKARTFSEGEVIKGVTVKLFKILLSVNKAETNWRDSKTKKDIKFCVRFRDKAVKVISYKMALDLSIYNPIKP